MTPETETTLIDDRRSLALAIRQTIGWLLRADTSASAMILNIVTQMALVVVSFGTGVIIARHLGAAGRGEVAALTLWPMFFSGLFAFGLPTALVHYSRRFPKDQASLFSAALAMLGASSILMLIVALVIIPRSLHKYDAQVISWALWLMLVAPQVLLGLLATAFFQVRGKFAFYNQTRYVPALLTLVGLLGLLFFHRLTPEFAALCYLIPPLPMFALALFRVFKMAPPTKVDFRESAGRLLNYGLRAAGIDLLGALSQQVDQVLVIGFLNASTMGTYVVALSVSRILNVLFTAINMVVSPEIVGRSPEDMTAYVGRTVRLAIFCGLVGALLMAAVIPFLLPRLYGHEFAASVPLVFILMGELLLSGPTATMAEAFKANGRPGLITIIEAATLGTSVLLMLTFIPRLGVIGAALSLLLASAIRLTAIVSCYRNVVGTRPPHFIINMMDLRYAWQELSVQIKKTGVS